MMWTDTTHFYAATDCKYLGRPCPAAERMIGKLAEKMNDAALTGTWETTPGQDEWAANDSYCRQTIWGNWDHGAYDGTNLPGPDPNWPVRQALQLACPTVIATVVDVEQIRDGA